MPRPYSTDLRGRALLACERDGDSCAAVARRFRVGISTLHLWRKQARDEGRRAPRRMGRGPAPLGGRLAALAELAAEHRDATLAEYADLLAERTGEPKRSTPVICRALKRLGWVRKQRRSGPTSGTGRTWRSPAPRGAARPPGSTRPAERQRIASPRTDQLRQATKRPLGSASQPTASSWPSAAFPPSATLHRAADHRTCATPGLPAEGHPRSGLTGMRRTPSAPSACASVSVSSGLSRDVPAACGHTAPTEKHDTVKLGDLERDMRAVPN